MFHPKSELEVCHDLILQIISYQIKDYMRDHGSIGLFWEWCFGEEFGSECLGLFLFCFCLVWGEKVASPKDFCWRSKGEDHSKSWFPSFSCLLVTILYCSDIAWSKDFSVFCFLPTFDLEFLFHLMYRVGKLWDNVYMMF